MRLGICSFLGRGHLDPCAALGRGLIARGHDVTLFHLSIAQAAVAAEGLRFWPLDRHEQPQAPPAPPRGRWRWSWRETIDALRTHAVRTLREGPDAIDATGIEALLADQLDLAAGTIAQRAGIPHVTICCAPPTYLEEAMPPPYFGWNGTRTRWDRLRNRCGNAAICGALKPVIDLINDHRRRWRLAPLASPADALSKLAVITQLPAALELPCAGARRRVFYTGPFRDDHPRRAMTFPWERLDGRPLVYASMGTVRNRDARAFRIIADACAGFDLQLVLSLGGGMLLPEDLGELPGQPIVVHYAPQAALLRSAALVINPAGLNTSLDALRLGLPIIGIPVAEDQPGVAARLRRAHVAVIVPYRVLSVRRLSAAISAITKDPSYRTAASQWPQALSEISGVARAADIIERVLQEG